MELLKKSRPLCQYIIEKVLHMNMPQIMDRADAAHWSWWMEE